MTDATGPMLAADGTPLKKSLSRALRRQKIRALTLIAPLLLFILITFIFPIAQMLFRSVENQLQGKFDRSFTEDGILVEIAFPATSITG